MLKPIKRSKEIIPISREHHHGLLLSWKIREGFRKNIEPNRIKDYTNWFWEHHLIPHFEFEEHYMFPILGDNNELIIRALREHTRLKELFSQTDSLKENLLLIEKELKAHIRFEERILFAEIEKVATEIEMNRIEKEHSKNISEDWKDEFWQRN